MASKGVIQFLNEVRKELAKVEWPSINEFIGSTLVVLVLVCFFAVYLGAVDLVLAKITKYIFKAYSG